MSKNDNVSDNIFQKQGNTDNLTGNQSAVTQFPRLNKLKIVGNGMNNWSVATCGPFYLIDADQNSSSNNNPIISNESASQPLTGATNLITHYGLLSTYHKFCGRPFIETLSSFLPNIPGNLDTPASENDSGLMNLLRKPPVQKEILTFSSSSLAEAFRLYNEKLPQCADWFTNESQKSVHNMMSESKKRKRRYSNLTFGVNEMAGAHPMLAGNATADTNLFAMSGGVANAHESASQQMMNTKINTADTASKTMSSGSGLFSTQNPSGILISPLTIKSKKSKRSDDEEKRKKKKKDKKKKKERNID